MSPDLVMFEPQTVLTVGARGTWYPAIVDGKRTAKLVCPGCGTIAGIEDHDIGADGKVTPSILCDCGYHQHIFLAGWKR